jgi:hypothetical protein
VAALGELRERAVCLGLVSGDPVDVEILQARARAGAGGRVVVARHELDVAYERELRVYDFVLRVVGLGVRER